jgi:hypothetical protein
MNSTERDILKKHEDNIAWLLKDVRELRLDMQYLVKTTMKMQLIGIEKSLGEVEGKVKALGEFEFVDAHWELKSE